MAWSDRLLKKYQVFQQNLNSQATSTDCFVHRIDDNVLLNNDWIFKNFPSMGIQYSVRARPEAPKLLWLNRFDVFTFNDVRLEHIRTRGQARMLFFVLTGLQDLNK